MRIHRIFRLITPMLSLLFAAQVQAAFELGLDFSYKKTVYGSDRQNEITSRTYSGSFNWFILRYTALEFNYSYTDDISTENNEIGVTNDVSIIGTQNRVNRKVFGFGLRQYFARRKAFVRPSLSLGYARQIIEDQTDITFRDDTNGATATSQGELTRRIENSVFGSFGLQFTLTRFLSLEGSVHTVFKAFEYNRAKDNLRYSVGLSWMFF